MSKIFNSIKVSEEVKKEVDLIFNKINMESYKKASELGLEAIELEDQVLLVDKTTIELNQWYFNERTKTILRCSHMNIDSIKSMNQKGLHKVCYSTKQLEGLSLLVIENEKEVVKSNLEKICAWESFQDHPIGRYAKEALEEYNKAKETYKFTEKDLRKAYIAGRNKGAFKSEKNFNDLLESLTKKELWIEVECSGRNCIEEYGCTSEVCNNVKPDIPKITNNQIKALWK